MAPHGPGALPKTSSGGAKSIAKQCACPVIALAQLSREASKRNGPPRLSDLRESGSIEQDADMVLFLHRSNGPAYEGAETENIDLVVAKNRDGALARIPMVFHRSYTMFKEA